VPAAAPPSGPPRSAERHGRSARAARHASRACRRRAEAERRLGRHRDRRPWTTACAPPHVPDVRHPQRHRASRACAPPHAADEPLRPRPSTRACAPRRAPDGTHPHRRPSTTACAPRLERDGHHLHRRPSTTACAPRPVPGVPRWCPHRATRACAPPHAADAQLRPRPSTRAYGPRRAQVARLPRREVPWHGHHRAAHAEHPRIRARTAASHHRVHAGSATIRGPGPRAGCLDRMSRSLCSCRPWRPDDVCGVVGAAEVKYQANRWHSARADADRPDARDRTCPARARRARTSPPSTDAPRGRGIHEMHLPSRASTHEDHGIWDTRAVRGHAVRGRGCRADETVGAGPRR